MGGVCRPVSRVVSNPVKKFIGSQWNTGVPRTGLLLYLGAPNSDEYLIGEDTEIGEDTYIWGFFTGADETIRAATGWTNSNGWETAGNPFYYDDGTARVAWATEIASWSSINTGFVLFKLTSSDSQTGKLAVYATNTDSTILDEAKEVLGII